MCKNSKTSIIYAQSVTRDFHLGGGAHVNFLVEQAESQKRVTPTWVQLKFNTLQMP